MKLLRDIISGAGYLEGYGDHPGTLPLFVFIILSGLAGIDGGIMVALGCMGVMTVLLCPVWMVGCVSRARDYQRDQEQVARKLKQHS